MPNWKKLCVAIGIVGVVGFCVLFAVLKGSGEIVARVTVEAGADDHVLFSGSTFCVDGSTFTVKNTDGRSEIIVGVHILELNTGKLYSCTFRASKIFSLTHYTILLEENPERSKWKLIERQGREYTLQCVSRGGQASTEYGDLHKTTAYVWDNDPVAKQFQRAFPTAQHAISYFTGEYGETAFWARHEWPDGWMITLRFGLEVDHRNNAARAITAHSLIVEDPVHVEDWPLGPQYEVPANRWEEFMKSSGDRSILGIPK